MFFKNDSESFFSSILKLISIDNLHIYNPKVLHIAYLLFSSIKFDEFIENFLYLNLLTKSPHAIDNCKKCHLAGFDCFLLDELSNLKKQDYSVQKENQIKKTRECNYALKIECSFNFYDKKLNSAPLECRQDAT